MRYTRNLFNNNNFAYPIATNLKSTFSLTDFQKSKLSHFLNKKKKYYSIIGLSEI